MSNNIKKEFSQDIEKELEDFNNNFSPKKEFSQDENKKNFDNLEYNEKNQRIIQKEYLFDWIISICNKFLIGVSLVFCMFMFEFKNDLIETENFFNLVYLVFLIIILCLVFFLNFGKRLYKFFFNQLKIVIF